MLRRGFSIPTTDMPLNNQPYIPFFVKDWLTNSKLKMCSPAAHGLMINLMCIMHKEEDYGTILLRQKFRQTERPIDNFAAMLDRMLAFTSAEIIPALEELIEEGVVKIEGDCLVCKRMVKASELSNKRSSSGSKGAAKTNSKFAAAKTSSNSVSVYDNVNDNDVTIIDPRFQSWFEAYGKFVGEHEAANYWRRVMKPQEKDMVEKITPLYVEATPKIKYRLNPLKFLQGKYYMDKDIINNFNEQNVDWIKDALGKL